MKRFLLSIVPALVLLSGATSAFSQAVAPQQAAPAQPAAGAQRQIPPQLLKMFDADGDGKLSEQESAKLREAMAKRRAAGAGAVGGGARPGEVALPEGTKTYRDVRYGPHQERNVLDVYVPGPSDKPYPLIIWIHGGGWKNGSKESARPALALLSEGFAVAAINYRLSGHDVFPAQIKDCKAAIRFLRARAEDYNVDPNRFAVWGSSAGGHLSALVGTSGEVKELEGTVGDFDEVSSRVQAVCDWYGPTDLTQMGGRHNDAESPESALLGGPVPQKKKEAALANPITYVTRDDPPFLIMHGTADPVVIPSQSELLDAALRKTGIPTKLVPIEGAGHGGPEFQTPEIRAQVVAFFRENLKPKTSAAAR